MPEERTLTGTVLAVKRTQTLSIVIANKLATVAAQTTLDIEGLIATMKASGMADVAIYETLVADLTAGGRLFGTFRNQLKNTVRGGIKMAATRGLSGQYEKAGVKEFVWVTAGKPCPDCDSRAGEKGTMDYFQNIGMPGSGFSVCQANCMCVLEHIGYKGATTMPRS